MLDTRTIAEVAKADGVQERSVRGVDRRNAARRRRYDERVAAKLCVRCPSPSLDDKPHCARCDASVAKSKRAAAKRTRDRRRRAKACLTCGRPRKDRSRCPRCLIAQGRAPTARSVRGVDRPSLRSSVQGLDTRMEVDGYARERNHGRARRGPPPKVDTERLHVKIATQILERWRDSMEFAFAQSDLSAQEKKRCEQAWRDYARQMRDLAGRVAADAREED